jgi:hypothetical protein
MHCACWITKITHTRNMSYLFLFHGNSGHAKAPQCYIIRSLRSFIQNRISARHRLLWHDYTPYIAVLFALLTLRSCYLKSHFLHCLSSISLSFEADKTGTETKIESHIKIFVNSSPKFRNACVILLREVLNILWGIN